MSSAIDPADPFREIGGEPVASDVDAFLAGPWNYERWQDGETSEAYCIDRIFGKPLADILPDNDLEPIEGVGDWPSIAAPGYRMRAVASGVVVVDDRGDLVGAYVGCDIGVLPEHEGRGLGSELVVERVLMDGQPPLWDHDKAAYSPAGAETHRKAWRLMRDEAWLRRKLDGHPLHEVVAPTLAR